MCTYYTSIEDPPQEPRLSRHARVAEGFRPPEAEYLGGHAQMLHRKVDKKLAHRDIPFLRQFGFAALFTRSQPDALVASASIRELIKSGSKVAELLHSKSYSFQLFQLFHVFLRFFDRVFFHKSPLFVGKHEKSAFSPQAKIAYFRGRVFDPVFDPFSLDFRHRARIPRARQRMFFFSQNKPLFPRVQKDTKKITFSLLIFFSQKATFEALDPRFSQSWPFLALKPKIWAKPA